MRSLSKIIKADFRPIWTKNGQENTGQYPPIIVASESNGASAVESAAAIVDAAAVIRTARARAHELVREAEERIVELVTAAEKQADAIRQEAQNAGFEAGQKAGYEDGYRAGLAAARAAMEAEMQEKLADVVEIARECQALKGRIIAQAEKDIVALSLAISEKVIRKKVEDDPSVTFDIIRDLAERVQNAEQVAIRVHPKVLEMMDGLMKNGDNGTPDGEASSWRWVPDAGVQPGGCIVETEFGRLDARLDTRLLDVSQALLELLDGE
jgi:flagellar assembly protein FliH